MNKGKVLRSETEIIEFAEKLLPNRTVAFLREELALLLWHRELGETITTNDVREALQRTLWKEERNGIENGIESNN